MNYHIITITSFDSASIIASLEKQQNEHIILDALESDCTIENIASLQDVLEKRHENGFFFALLNTTIDIDDLEDEINIAPTLQEAVDMLEMEIMMRDL